MNSRGYLWYDLRRDVEREFGEFTRVVDIGDLLAAGISTHDFPDYALEPSKVRREIQTPSLRTRRTKARRVAAGLCPTCEAPTDDYLCGACATKHRAEQVAIAARRLGAGLCRRSGCKNAAEDDRSYCAEDAAKNRARAARNRQRRRSA